MAQEEQQRCSNSSSGGGGGGKVVKKPKPKKIPQRGLGVAQLEKIRLEEIQKKEASSSSPPCVFVPLTHNHHHHHHHQSSSSSSIPFSQPCPCPSISSSSPSSNTLLKSSSSNALPLPNFDLFIPPPTLSTTTSFYGFNNYNNSQETVAVGLGGASTTTTTTTGHGYFSTMSHPCESNRDQDDVTELDPGFALRSRLQNDSNLPWPPLPITMQRKPQPPSSMVNVCMSSSTPSGLNLQMEPPSNQSYYSNYTPPPHMWPEEEKMVGMKRPWPFSLDNPPGSSLPYKLPQFITPPISRLDESSSCGNSGLFNFEPGNAVFREGPSGSTPIQPGNAVFREGPSGSTPIHIEWRGSSSELNSKNGSTETGALDGKFLTLGLPPTPSSTITSKAKQPLAFPTSRQRELSEYDMIPFPFQVYTDDPYFGSSGSVQQPPFYSFFPPRGQQISRLTAKPNDQRTEIRDVVDLNLRL